MNGRLASWTGRAYAVLALGLLTACNPLKPDLVDKSLGKIRHAAVFIDFSNPIKLPKVDQAVLGDALQTALQREVEKDPAESRPAFIPMTDFPASPLDSLATKRPQATHAILIHAALVSRPYTKPAYYDPCAYRDKKSNCISNWVPEEKQSGGIEASIEVYDLRAARPSGQVATTGGTLIYRASSKGSFVQIPYAEETADSAAGAVAWRVIDSLRKAELI